MTREEVKSCISTIEMLQRLAYNIHGVMDVIDADNCKKIIKALEQEPSEDLISRQAVLELVADYDLSMGQVVRGIHALPPVNPQEPKTGHWIEKEGFDGDTYYDCSECGESFCLIDGTPTDNIFNYCPNCGAKMVEQKESEV